MRILIAGATSGIAKECARIWAQSEGTELVLVARDTQKLAAMAADLRVRSPKVAIQSFSLNLVDPAEVADLETRLRALGELDVALIAQGELTDQGLAQSSAEALAKSLTVNATSVALFAELAARIMEPQGHGSIALIGSVAGDRARRANYSYGAAKAFIDTYVRGMRHRFAGSGIRVTVIKPGPTATPMTTALATSGNLASASQVAADIVFGISGGKSVVYTPGLWRYIMLVVRLIPQPIFDKLNF